MGDSCYNISGNPAVVHSPAKASIENMKIHFLPVQEGSDDPSPTNIRNINGLTSINAYQTGKNVAKIIAFSTKGSAVTAEDTGYGTSLNTTEPGNSITVTQSTYTTDYSASSSRNGYFVIKLENFNNLLKMTKLHFSAKINMISNPLNVTKLDLCPNSVQGTNLNIDANGNASGTINQNLSGTREYLEIRVCGCSFTMTDIMITPYNYADDNYESYNEKIIPIEMKTIGKNLIHTKYPSRTATGVTFTVNADWSITVNGTATATTWLCPALIDKPQYHTFLKAGTYFLSGGKSANKAVYLAGRYIDGTPLSQSWDQGSGKLYTFKKDIWVYPQICIEKNETINNETFYIQLEQGSSATEYEPYSETEQTIYGGYIDPAEGKLVAEYVKISPTKEEFTTQYSSGIGYRQTTPKYSPTASGVIWNTARQQQLCNKAVIANPYSESAETYGEYMGIVFTMEASTTVAYARISEALYQTLEEGETVEFTYKLTTPITYNIPKQQLNTLLGTSTYWSDAVQNVDINYKVVDSADMISARKRIISHAPHTVVNDEQSLSKVITFNTDMKGNLSSCITSFTPSQSGTGTPATDNIMPIVPCKEIQTNHTGRAIAQLAGFSCKAMLVQAPPQFALSGNYGTTINTVAPNIDTDAVVITQANYPNTEQIYSYQNGYVTIGFYDLEFDRRYKVSMDITNITNNPLSATLYDLHLGDPYGGQNGASAVNGNRVTFEVLYRRNKTNANQFGFDLRNCGMSCTVSNIIVTDVNESDQSYEQFINPCGKNLALVYGYGAANMSSNGSLQRTNSGTTLSTIAYTLPDLPVVITQSTYDETLTDKSDYHNGYMVVATPRLIFNKRYNISFRITDITNNPLSATLSNFKIVSPAGNHYPGPTVIGDRVIFYDVPYTQYAGNGRCGWDIRFCGMSCTLSEFMVTETSDSASTFEPYCGNPHTITLPPLGKNLFPCRESEMTSSGWYRYFPNCLKEPGTYTISCQNLFGGTGNLGCRVSMSDSPENGGTIIGNTLTGWAFSNNESNKTATFTLTQQQANAPYIKFEMLSSGSTYADIAGGKLQIEKGSTATSYERYSEQVCGKLDVVTGKFTAEWEYRSARWGDIKQSYNINSNTGMQGGTIPFSNNVLNVHSSTYYGENTLCNICSILWKWTEDATDHYYIDSNQAYICLPTTTDDDTIIEVAAKLQSPIIIQLTPTQIKTLQGYNALRTNVEMDSVKYWTH